MTEEMWKQIIDTVNRLNAQHLRLEKMVFDYEQMLRECHDALRECHAS